MMQIANATSMITAGAATAALTQKPLISMKSIAYGIQALMSLVGEVVSYIAELDYYALQVMQPFGAMISVLFIVWGAFFSIFLQTVPYMIILFSLISWILIFVEALMASPLMALGLAQPNSQQFWGATEPSLMMLLMLYLRPVTIVIACVIATFMSVLATYLLNHSFAVLITDLLPSVDDTAVDSVIFMGALMLYSYIAFMMLIQCFAIVGSLPDKIAQWIGGGPLGGDSPMQRVMGIRGSFESGVQGAAQGASQTAKGGTIGAIKAVKYDYGGNMSQMMKMGKEIKKARLKKADKKAIKEWDPESKDDLKLPSGNTPMEDAANDAKNSIIDNDGDMSRNIKSKRADLRKAELKAGNKEDDPNVEACRKALEEAQEEFNQAYQNEDLSAKEELFDQLKQDLETVYRDFYNPVSGNTKWLKKMSEARLRLHKDGDEKALGLVDVLKTMSESSKFKERRGGGRLGRELGSSRFMMPTNRGKSPDGGTLEDYVTKGLFNPDVMEQIRHSTSRVRSDNSSWPFAKSQHKGLNMNDMIDKVCEGFK